MAVKSRNLENPGDIDAQRPPEAKPAPKPQPSSSERIPRSYGLVAIAIGILFWPLGAWYTLLGWVWSLNIALEFYDLPWRVPTPTGLIGVAAAGIVGYIYTRIELAPPKPQRKNRMVWLLLLLVWFGVMLSDLGTTFAGAIQPVAEDAWPLARWAAESWSIAAIWALVLTFIPDQLMLRGGRIIRGKSPF